MSLLYFQADNKNNILQSCQIYKFKPLFTFSSNNKDWFTFLQYIQVNVAKVCTAKINKFKSTVVFLQRIAYIAHFMGHYWLKQYIFQPTK